jgi:chromosome segregation ATPase
VATTCQTIQSDLYQKQVELERARKDVKALVETQTALEQTTQRWKQDKASFEQKIKDAEHQVDELQKVISEKTAMEYSRKKRTTNLEEECRQMQTMLVEATSGQKHAAQTIATLRESMAEIQKSSKEMYQQSDIQQELSRKEKERLNEALTKSEKEAQQLRIQAEESEEETQRLRLDKTAVEKNLAQLKYRVASLENRLKDTDASLTTPASVTTKATAATTSSNTITAFSIPPLLDVLNTGDSKKSTTAGGCCCICFADAYGVMKSCQCGTKTCGKRAHVACFNRTQPGPSDKAVVLCKEQAPL